MRRTKSKKDRKAAPTTTENRPAPGPCPVVTIGASAGGLEMFQQFFAHMPRENGMAFVLIQHLDPNHDYVIPANALLTMQRGTLQVSRPAASVTDRMPVDFFLRSVASDQGENLIAIILSGIGTDGTLGLKAVKEHGGMTLAQSLETAKYDSMPRSAISTGLVDHIIPVEQMPARIIEYFNHLRALERKKGALGLHEEVVKALSK